MLKICLIGCGRIAKRHSELIGNKQIPGLELVGVCDINIDKAKYIAEKFSIPAFKDYKKMIEQLKPDLVSVLTPSGMHAKHVVECAGLVRNILVEKPMALTLADADYMIKKCDENATRLFVVKQNRFNLPVLKLREAVEEKRLGKLVMGTVRVRWCRPQKYYDQDYWRGTWALDGGVLANQASHHVDLLEWMMGEVESVFAMSRTALVEIETEDTAVVALRFRNGALGIIEATTATRPVDLEGSLSVLGANGTVEIGGFAVNEMKVWNFSEQQPEDENVLQNYSVNPPDVYGFGHKSYYEHVVDCIKNNKKQLVDGLEGRKSLELITAIYESIETGKEVFLRFIPKKCKLGMEP